MSSVICPRAAGPPEPAEQHRIAPQWRADTRRLGEGINVTYCERSPYGLRMRSALFTVPPLLQSMVRGREAGLWPRDDVLNAMHHGDSDSGLVGGPQVGNVGRVLRHDRQPPAPANVV